MTTINIDLTSTIKQENDQETIHQDLKGEISSDNGVVRIAYEEEIPNTTETLSVKMLLKQDELTIRRGSDRNNHSLMHFKIGEKMPCRYLVEGRQMDLDSVTNILNFEKNEDSGKLHVEYDLFSGLYLVGNYAVTLIFTK